MWSAIFVVGCQSSERGEKPADEAQPLETIQADTLRVELSNWPVVIHSQGNLSADEESVIGPKIAGRVAEIHVDLGDSVRAGDPIATLDKSDFLLQVERAEAQLNQARSAVGLSENDSVDTLVAENSPAVQEQKSIWEEAKLVLSRAERLQQQQAISDSEYDQAVAMESVEGARYRSSINGFYEKVALIQIRQVELSLAKQQLDDSEIVAPIDGFIQQRHVAVGSYLSVGQPVAVVVRNHPLRFQGTVSERYAQAIEVGQRVLLTVESISKPIAASITRVSPSLQQRSRALLFEAEVDNHDRRLRTGLFAEAEIVIEPDARSLVVPQSAVQEFAGTQKVWKVTDGVAGEQEVLIGDRKDGQLQILEGIEQGDLILVRAASGRVARVSQVLPDANRSSDSSAEVSSSAEDQNSESS